jgi:DNA-binding XRE family transcriptional regulator
MTNTSNKDMSWLAMQIRAALPEAKVDIYRPGPKGKGWIIDASHRDHLVVVMWTAASGFGVATPTEDDGCGTPPGEYYEQPEPALARVLHLLRSGEQAKTRREMQLQELRDHRSISQERLAKAMKVSQAHISQTERRPDVLLSTLQSYVEGLGGELLVLAKFPGETIELEFQEPVKKSG